MDEHDRQIIQLLQSDNLRSGGQIGRTVGLSISAVNERVRRLQRSGIIRGNHAVLDPDHVGLRLCAFAFVDLTPHPNKAKFYAQTITRPEVLEFHQVSGNHDYLLKIRSRSLHAFRNFLERFINSQSEVSRIETVIVMETVKESHQLAMPELGKSNAAQKGR